MLSTAFLVATTDCPLSCGYCFYETGHQRKVAGGIRAGRIQPLFEALAARDVTTVVITGGEPALRGDLEAIVASGAEAGLEMVLLTSGRGLCEDRIAALHKAGLGAVTIAIDGHATRSLKTVRPLVVHLALETPLNVTLIFTLTRRNLTAAKDVLSFASTLSIGMLLEPVYLPRGHRLRPSLSLAHMTGGEKRRLEAFVEQWQQIHGEKQGIELVQAFYDGDVARPVFCPMGAGGIVVNADGNCLPCFHREDLVIGNVLDEDPREVLARRGSGRFALAAAPCFGEQCLTLFMNS